MSTDIARRLREARARADANFAREAAALTHLTEAEIRDILPDYEDQQRFIELMETLEDETKNEREKAEAIRGASAVLEVALRVLGRLV